LRQQHSASNPQLRGFVLLPTVSWTQGVGINVGHVGFQDGTAHQNTIGGTGRMTGSFYSFLANPTFTANTNNQTPSGHTGFRYAPVFAIASGATLGVTATYGFHVGALNVGSGVTITAATGVLISAPTITGTITTWRGIDIASVTGAGTNVGIRNASSLRQQAAATFGADAAATWLIHMQGGNAANAAIGLDVSTTGPTAPSSNTSGAISVYKGATNYYLLVTFNDGGTTRYKYMQLNGTGTTWTHGTTLPT